MNKTVAYPAISDWVRLKLYAVLAILSLRIVAHRLLPDAQVYDTTREGPHLLLLVCESTWSCLRNGISADPRRVTFTFSVTNRSASTLICHRSATLRWYRS